jgi:hypothetical protein
LNLTRSLRQRQERGLKSVFRGVVAADDSPTGAPDHGSMTMDQHLEGDGVMRLTEAIQQFNIGNFGGIGKDGP